jgi:hypothetical protein
MLFDAPESIKIFKFKLGIVIKGSFGLLERAFRSVVSVRQFPENFVDRFLLLEIVR